MNFEHGIYQHYKGDRYTLLMTARHSETKETLVIYESLKTGGTWARPAHMWEELVVWPDGVTRPRFVREEPTSIRFSLSSSLAEPDPK